MIKDYYKILEIDRQASAVKIKKAYRQLALQYHPDRNKDLRAHKVFMLINEAHEILGNSEKKVHYDCLYDFYTSLQEKIIKNTQPSGEEFTIAKQRKRNTFSNQADFIPYTKYARLMSVFTLLFCLALVADYFGARGHLNEIVDLKTANILIAGRPGPNPFLTVKTTQCEFPLDGEKYNYVVKGDTINAFITPLFNITTKVELLKNGSIQAFDPHYNVYNIFSFFLVALLGTSILGTFLTKKYPEHVFNAGITNGALFPLVLYFVLIS